MEQTPSSIRVLRLAADDSFIRELSFATGGRGNHHGTKASLGLQIHNLVAILFPTEEDASQPEAIIQWLQLHNASDDYMALTVEIYGLRPGPDNAAAIAERQIQDHIRSQVARSSVADRFEKMRIFVQINPVD